MPTIDLIIPVLNEAGALPWLLGRLPDGVRAIVVDNGSTDDSAAVAMELGARVVSEPVRGFGSACFAGLTAATADIVAFCDGDGSMDPADMAAVTTPVIDGTYDLVLGARRPVPGAMQFPSPCGTGSGHRGRLAGKIAQIRVGYSTFRYLLLRVRDSAPHHPPRHGRFLHVRGAAG